MAILGNAAGTLLGDDAIMSASGGKAVTAIGRSDLEGGY
jgi:hypothetical protein